MTPDIAAVTALVEEVAATEILPRFEKLAAHEIREKSPGDVVTIADEAAEAWLTPRLVALLPGSLVLGEEAAAVDPDILRRLDEAESLWLIDPVDGTHNFVRGYPSFCVSIGLVQGGESVLGAIYDAGVDSVTWAVEGGGGQGPGGGPRRRDETGAHPRERGEVASPPAGGVHAVHVVVLVAAGVLQVQDARGVARP